MPTARILVVDDEPMIARLASTMLEQEGYEVFTAISARDALAAAGNEQPIDLVLSDFLMPEMNGLELVRKFMERSPGTAALLMSGYLGSYCDLDMPVLQKPFSATVLLSMVKQALEQSGQAGENNSLTGQKGRERRAIGEQVSSELDVLARTADQEPRQSKGIAGGNRS